jgi:hypothetical protein
MSILPTFPDQPTTEPLPTPYFVEQNPPVYRFPCIFCNRSLSVESFKDHHRDAHVDGVNFTKYTLTRPFPRLVSGNFEFPQFDPGSPTGLLIWYQDIQIILLVQYLPQGLLLSCRTDHQAWPVYFTFRAIDQVPGARPNTALTGAVVAPNIGNDTAWRQGDALKVSPSELMAMSFVPPGGPLAVHVRVAFKFSESKARVMQ